MSESNLLFDLHITLYYWSLLMIRIAEKCCWWYLNNCKKRQCWSCGSKWKQQAGYLLVFNQSIIRIIIIIIIQELIVNYIFNDSMNMYVTEWKNILHALSSEALFVGCNIIAANVCDKFCFTIIWGCISVYVYFTIFVISNLNCSLTIWNYISVNKLHNSFISCVLIYSIMKLIV